MIQNFYRTSNKKKNSLKHPSNESQAEFSFTWMLVLWTGLIIFSQIEGALDQWLGKCIMLIYLIATLYHTILAASFYLYKGYLLIKQSIGQRPKATLGKNGDYFRNLTLQGNPGIKKLQK